MNGGARFSDCGLYRYRLFRRWALFESERRYTPANVRPDDRWCHFIMLNPSTADAKKNDPTVSRCMRYAMSWGYRGLLVSNIFAFRSPHPQDLRGWIDPVGPDNNTFILDAYLKADITIAAWGNHGRYLNRDIEVAKLIPNLHCLALSKDGNPKHPLYLPKSLKPIPFTVRQEGEG